MLKVVVSFIRANGHKVIMFLDDGIGGHRDLNLAIQSSDFTRKALCEFGFLLADDKCNWVPSCKVTWLGHLIDMERNLLFISEDRINRLCTKLESVLFQVRLSQHHTILVKILASVTGQIISLQHVIGNKVRLRTRELFNCINTRASWNAPVIVTDAAISELEYWKCNVVSLNSIGKRWKNAYACLYNVFCDASAIGYGGYVESVERNAQENVLCTQVSEICDQMIKGNDGSPEVEPSTKKFPVVQNRSLEMDEFGSSVPTEKGTAVNTSTEIDHWEQSSKKQRGLPQGPVIDCCKSELDNKPCTVKSDASCQESFEVLGEWNLFERGKSSTWRETEAVSRVLKSSVALLRNSSVNVYSDNKNVQSVLLNGSRKTDIQSIALDLSEVCDNENIEIHPVWIPREGNQQADYLSRCLDSDDWEINNAIYQKLNSVFGPYSIDRFASHLNNKCERYNSRFWVPGTEAVDAFSQYWGRDKNWAVPPPRLVSACVEKIIREKAVCTLVIPLWKSSSFWPTIVDSNGTFRVDIKHVVNLSRINVVSPGKGNNGIFAKNPLSFDMLALHFDM